MASTPPGSTNNPIDAANLESANNINDESSDTPPQEHRKALMIACPEMKPLLDIAKAERLRRVGGLLDEQTIVGRLKAEVLDTAAVALFLACSFGLVKGLEVSDEDEHGGAKIELMRERIEKMLQSAGS